MEGAAKSNTIPKNRYTEIDYSQNTSSVFQFTNWNYISNIDFARVNYTRFIHTAAPFMYQQRRQTIVASLRIAAAYLRRHILSFLLSLYHSLVRIYIRMCT